jgi:hypothetical protein
MATNFEASTKTAAWEPLTAIDAGELRAARLETHWALQVIAAVGMAHLEPADDDSHRNMGWLPDFAAFVGRPFGDLGLRVALRVEDLSLHILDSQGQSRERISVAGNDHDSLHAAVAEAVARVGDSQPQELGRVEFDLPEHPVGRGERYAELRPAAQKELAKIYANAHTALEAIRVNYQDATDVRVWPHHFDLASLRVLESDASGTLSKSVGLGLSPGDDKVDEPYFYVTPWPYPELESLEALPAGAWHTEGWTGALLRLSELDGLDASGQSSATLAYFSAAIENSVAALAPNHLK